jgi:hypothetical protein
MYDLDISGGVLGAIVCGSALFVLFVFPDAQFRLLRKLLPPFDDLDFFSDDIAAMTVYP